MSDQTTEPVDLPHRSHQGGMTMAQRLATPSYLRTSQVADLLHVSPKTVSRWALEGRLPFLRTLGGHRRYPETEIRALVATSTVPAENGQA